MSSQMKIYKLYHYPSTEEWYFSNKKKLMTFLKDAYITYLDTESEEVRTYSFDEFIKAEEYEYMQVKVL